MLSATLASSGFSSWGNSVQPAQVRLVTASTYFPKKQRLFVEPPWLRSKMMVVIRFLAKRMECGMPIRWHVNRIFTVLRKKGTWTEKMWSPGKQQLLLISINLKPLKPAIQLLKNGNTMFFEADKWCSNHWVWTHWLPDLDFQHTTSRKGHKIT